MERPAAPWWSRPLYELYERRLLGQIRVRLLPRHVALILDGNRRSARKHGLTDPRAIYDRGAKKLNDVLAWCVELGIGAMTLWVCSTENLARSPDEVSGILGAVEAKIDELARDPWIHRHRVRVEAIGRLGLLPPSTLAAIGQAQQATASYQAMTLTIAVGYGGREEICDAVRSLLAEQAREGASLAEAIERVTPEAIDPHLYTADLPDPDLIIRTSGEIRLSGFLLWQSARSEFYFTDVNWPEFRKLDFLRALRSFQRRNRRFGL
jgi:short-chain Z-isoprenyl diphosphate synthase